MMYLFKEVHNRWKVGVKQQESFTDKLDYTVVTIKSTAQMAKTCRKMERLVKDLKRDQMKFEEQSKQAKVILKRYKGEA